MNYHHYFVDLGSDDGGEFLKLYCKRCDTWFTDRIYVADEMVSFNALRAEIFLHENPE